jgi:glycosyltransferase involved in cell wall biosynthesis
MKLSIVTPCLNNASTIGDTLESVASQSYRDVEHIVVDGGSTDGTLGVLAKYSGQVKLIGGPDRGLYDALNKGVASATGDAIGVLNADDYLESATVLQAVHDELAAAPDAHGVYGDVVFVQPGDLQRVVRRYSSRAFRPWKLRFGWMPPHPGSFIRRAACATIGPYALDLKISADYEMFVKAMLVHHFKFVRVDRVLVRMRSGGISTSGLRASLRLNREIVTACRRNGVYTSLPLVLLKTPFKLLELAGRA